MRRSSSSSHIPQPKVDCRGKGKPSLGKENTGPRKRGSSSDRLNFPPLKRTNSLSNFKKSLTGTTPSIGQKTCNFRKTTGATPKTTLTAPKRSASTTPRSRSRSPFKIGSDRPMNDKEWVSQEFVKVRTFLQDEGHEQVTTFLKPPSLKIFVYVMNVFLKEIDPHVDLNTTNYKDIVLSMLKAIHYPGNVSNSLLKTVNTMHAWPQVISIFSWLVDLIITIRRVKAPLSPHLENDVKYKKVECITDYIAQRYFLYNEGGEEKADKLFVDKFVDILNIDEDEVKRLEEEVNKLSKSKEKTMKLVGDQKTENDNLQTKINNFRNETETFYSNKEERQENTHYTNEQLKDRRNKLVKNIHVKRENIGNLTEVLKTQPCSIEEKKRMLRHIEELKHTIYLKKEKIRTQKMLQEDCEQKLMEAKKQVQSEVYRLNNITMTLSCKEPELKILHLKDPKYEPHNFQDDINAFVKNVDNFKKKFTSGALHLQSLIPEIDYKILELENEIKKAIETIGKMKLSEDDCVTNIAACNKNIEELAQKLEAQKRAFIENIQKLNETRPNVDEAKGRLEKIKKLKQAKAEEFELLKHQTLQFFLKLHDTITKNVMNMNNTRTEIFTLLAESLKDIQKVQAVILQDLQELDDVKK